MATGMPLVEKCVTVDGTAIASPKNVIAPIGTSIKDILEFVGGTCTEVGKVLFGGPMMGVAAAAITDPIAKATNGITVFSDKDAYKPARTPCIHCGRCVSACPLGLNPVAFARARKIESKEERMARLDAERVNICMECGCCSYVCPAHRSLIQNNKIAKAELKDYKAHQETLID
jgi:electron transport complex protein RnfC